MEHLKQSKLFTCRFLLYNEFVLLLDGAAGLIWEIALPLSHSIRASIRHNGNQVYSFEAHTQYLSACHFVSNRLRPRHRLRSWRSLRIHFISVKSWFYYAWPEYQQAVRSFNPSIIQFISSFPKSSATGTNRNSLTSGLPIYVYYFAWVLGLHRV